MRVGHRQFLAGHRMGEGQDGGRSPGDQEHGHCPRTVAATSKDSLLRARGRRYQGGYRRLEEKAWGGSSRARKGLALVEALRGVRGVFRRLDLIRRRMLSSFRWPS